MELSIKMEVVSLLITTMLAWFHYDRQSRSNLRYQLFTLCLALSGTTIILDEYAAEYALFYFSACNLFPDGRLQLLPDV